MKFSPRFSVRTLAIFVTLVCAYFGAWEATKRYGVNVGNGEASPAPFVIKGWALRREELPRMAHRVQRTVQYNLWFFGPTIKLPIESE